mgnify:FL=1
MKVLNVVVYIVVVSLAVSTVVVLDVSKVVFVAF